MIEIYFDEECENKVSKSGIFTNPIFGSSYFMPGKVEDLQLFIRNEYSLDISNLNLLPVDLESFDESDWITLAFTEEGLDTAIPGAPLYIGELSSFEVKSFFIRATVPQTATIGSKRDLRLSAYYHISSYS